MNQRNANTIKIDISNDDDVEEPLNRDNNAVYILDDPPEAESDGFVDPILIETDLVCVSTGQAITSFSNAGGSGGVRGDVILLDIDDSDGDNDDHQMSRDITDVPTSSAGDNVPMQKGEVCQPLLTSDSTTPDLHVDVDVEVDVLIDDDVGVAPNATEGNHVDTMDPSIPNGDVIVNESLSAIVRGEMTDINPVSTLESSTKDTAVYESDQQLVSKTDQHASETVAVEMVEVEDTIAGHGSTSLHSSYENHCIDLSEEASQGEDMQTLENGASRGSRSLCDEQIVVIGDCGEELVVIEGTTSSSSSSSTSNNYNNGSSNSNSAINDNNNGSSTSSSSKRNASRRRTSSSSTSSPAEHSLTIPTEDESRIVLRCILQEIVEKSGLLRLLDTELRNESFLDIDNHSELYYLVYQVCSA